MAEVLPLVIVGAGGFGREILALATSINEESQTYDLLGFAAEEDANPAQRERVGARFLGSHLAPGFEDQLPDSTRFVVAVGDGLKRDAASRDLIQMGLVPASLVHPSVWIGPDVVVGNGSVICFGTAITTAVTMGLGAQINLNCTIGHDVVMGDFVTLSPAVNISGNVEIGDHATIHTNACILPGIRVGPNATVGAGAVVTKNVSPETVVVGAPARPLHK